MADTEYLSTRQAALRLGVSLGTVQNMVESGALEAWKTAGGHRRIPATSVDALLARRRNLTPSALESGGQLDILIADLMMPGMDGFEMIRRLRANADLARMDIIVVSAIDREEVIKRGLPSDITIFGKPIPFHEIKGFLLGRLAARQRVG